MTDHVYVHLKDLNRGEGRLREKVVHTNLGAEGIPMGVTGVSADSAYNITLNGCMCRAEITDEIILEDR